MLMPRAQIAPNEYYHIFNKTINNQTAFLDNMDYCRMLLYILLFQSPLIIQKICRETEYFRKYNKFNNERINLEEIAKERTIELVSFTVMPNHFHLLCRELKEGGISLYLQRIENAFTKYFNTRYERKGYLFQGPFQSVHIENNDQMLYLSTYIHRNQRELSQWKNKEHLYPWSSYYDCVEKNRWDKLLKPEIILEQFSNQKDYRNFVESSIAKISPDEKLFLD